MASMNDIKSDCSFFARQYRHAQQCLKEARFVAITWFAALFFCCGWIGSFGYLPVSERPDTPQLVLGLPAWAVWGLLAPWLVLIGITWFFAAVVLKDDEPLEAMPNQQEDVPDETPEENNG